MRTPSVARAPIHACAALQAPPELLTWMRTFGFKQQTVTYVEIMTFEEEPTVAKAEANVEALRSVLHMSDRQV